MIFSSERVIGSQRSLSATGEDCDITIPRKRIFLVTLQKHGQTHRRRRKDAEALLLPEDLCLPKHLAV
jgi:hypothetical protein